MRAFSIMGPKWDMAGVCFRMALTMRGILRTGGFRGMKANLLRRAVGKRRGSKRANGCLELCYQTI